ncbi:HlyD family type I secretion periplasmic adaptor subunit [Methylobacterium haplocladii]|uniref:Membrane fusion protein (MFP) family protein n=1 Tax=Methylobacterium haplocladii TaxID=1176176 RepID=A0A512IKT1_9HYPH|nr:HlyD family type I secretion periplasmic adaptor subunit [Methylobacterium haplocladii]GEO98311.1 HlyD family type I secretion periplasmic adaptor subunit [Methylobacterium haplocladii]GJD86379.1 Hemolysin secretion protein D, chromosomal [Methylobacterium haplocladii]GLS58395.1 HlyD family type I secretion periplasmic adaptor subunit [Methylobacterium haplocladii]
MSAQPGTTPPADPPKLPATGSVARSRLPVLRASSLPTSALARRIRTFANTREDQEFLPAHLAILETPPSPLAMVFTWTLCALFASALIWSFLANLDIYAVASGRVQSSGRSKVLQPFETSKVEAINVSNGARVKAGDLLISLDPTDAGADLAGRVSDLEALAAQMARRVSTIQAIREGQKTAEPAYAETTPLPIKMRETAAMVADLNQYYATRLALEAQIAEKQATEQRLTASIAARERLHAVLTERATMRETLVSRSAGTRAAVIDALQQVEQVAADLAYDQGQKQEAKAGVDSLLRRIEQLTSETIAKQAQSLTEIAQKVDSLRQDVIKARLRRERMELRAPIDGTVQQLAVTTVGQVVTASQPLLVLVPSDGPFEIEALLLNTDIGFVAPGQNVTVKVDSFPFTRYGTAEGKVVRVSRDAVDERDASGSTDTLSVVRSQGVSAANGTPRTQNLVFPVTVEVWKNNIVADGKPVALTPGMTVQVEIQTGTRRAIDYILSPIRETTSTAGHER